MSLRGLRSSDIGIAALAAATLITEAQLRGHGGPSPGAWALAVAAAAPLAWRTRAPLAALVAVEAGALACAIALDASWTATTMVVIELYTVALMGDRQRSVVVGAITAIVVVAAIVLIDRSLELTGIGLRLLLVFASVAVGDTVRSRRALDIAARERAARETHEREEEAHRRVAEERLRIAQELHDTLAHSLVAINVQSSVAVDLRERHDPYAALQDIKQASVTALHDLRATLSLLREPAETAPTVPAFGLDAVPRLVEHARAAGLRADVDVQVNGARVPSPVGAAAFRIVQEALTNVLRHADASSALVRIRSHPDSIEVEITDDGCADSTGAHTGLGLRGMLERTTALGGQLNTGPREQGGWCVHAMLPLQGGDEP